MKKITLLLLATLSTNSYSFDLEDYAATYHATRDAYNSAYNAQRLAEVAYLQVLNDNKGLIPMPTDGHAKSGLELNTCSHLADCKAARAASVVMPKLDAYATDPAITKLLTPVEAARLRSEVITYYSKLDDSINTDKAILFEETTDYYGIDMGQGINLAEPTNDPEVLSTEFRAKRDAYLKANNELKLATSPWQAAMAGYAAAVKNYVNYTNCADFGPGKTIDKMLDDGDLN